MEIEKQVASFGVSEELYELGMRLNTFFYWHDEGRLSWDGKARSWSIDEDEWNIPAPTVAELGEMLPRNIKIECGICTVKEWRVILFEKILDEKSKDFMKEKIIQITQEQSEADTRGKMVIYLIKNNLIKIKNRK